MLLSTITQGDHYDLIKPAPDSKDRKIVGEKHTFLICSISAALKNNTGIVILKDRSLGLYFDGPLHTVEGRKWNTKPIMPSGMYNEDIATIISKQSISNCMGDGSQSFAMEIR